MSSPAESIAMVVTDKAYLRAVVMHIHAPCSPEQLDRINEAVRSAGKNNLSKRTQTFSWIIRVQRVAWRYELDLMFDDEDDDNLLVATLDVRRTQSASRTLAHKRRVSQALLVLNAIIAEGLNTTTYCHLSWRYTADEVELPLRLPFNLPVAPTSDMQAVKGFRVSNDDGTSWIIFDLPPEPNVLVISARFEYDVRFKDTFLDETIRFGESLVAKTGFRNKEES